MAEKQQIPIAPFIYVGAAFLGYQIIIKPILEAVGLKKSTEDIEIEKGLTSKPFDPKYWRSIKTGGLVLKQSASQILAKKIWDAIGTFTDDEAMVYSVFKSMKSQLMVSQLSENFQSLYRKDLYEFLRSHLNNDEMKIILTIVNDLPATGK